MLILLSLLAADSSAAQMMKAAHPVMCAEATCGEPAARSPYRLEPNVAGPADGKAAAVAITGAQCAITAPTLCHHKPHTWLNASY